MIEYSEGDWHLRFLFQLAGSVVPKAFLYSLPSIGIAILIRSNDVWRQEFDMFVSGNKPQTWVAVSAIATLLVAFRTYQAFDRFWEGTGLLHMMRAEWFDAVSCLFAFSRVSMASKPREVDEFRQTLIRLTSILHGCAMHEIGAEENSDRFTEIIDLRGLDDATFHHLVFCSKHGFDKFEVVLHMIHCLITENCETGIVPIHAAIVSRVYQELSRGLVNLHNSKKIASVPFPYPYVQLVMMFLLGHTVVTPMIVCAYIEVTWWAAIVSFVWVFCAYGANFIATELEMPFGTDPNDLPLEPFQKEMNDSLRMLSHAKSDLLPGLSQRVVTDWQSLGNFDVIDLNEFVVNRKQVFGAIRRSTTTIENLMEPTSPHPWSCTCASCLAANGD
jgi:putative membrane protein